MVIFLAPRDNFILTVHARAREKTVDYNFHYRPWVLHKILKSVEEPLK